MDDGVFYQCKVKNLDKKDGNFLPIFAKRLENETDQRRESIKIQESTNGGMCDILKDLLRGVKDLSEVICPNFFPENNFRFSKDKIHFGVFLNLCSKF